LKITSNRLDIKFLKFFLYLIIEFLELNLFIGVILIYFKACIPFINLFQFKIGYVAIGVLKTCTFGFMLIGYIWDLVLIISQVLRPSDGSNYIVDYYGQVLYPAPLYNNNTYNLTSNWFANVIEMLIKCLLTL